MNPVVRRLPGALAALATLGGCAPVGPDFQTPDAEVAEAWQQAEDQRITSTSADVSEWWKSFNDPVLESLIQDAFWIAMALTIMFGLTFGTLLTMIMVPTFYATLNRIQSPGVS